MNLEQLLARMDAVAEEPPRSVTIAGLGEVHIREITIGEIDAKIVADGEGKKDRLALARGACRLLADEKGRCLLDPQNDDHVARMAKLPLRVLREINKAADFDKAIEPGN